MNYKSFKQLIYYRILRNLPKEIIPLPVNYTNKRNIFLYFDYEREFSGHFIEIPNSFIDDILFVLKESKVLTTWFSVGKLIEKYPESIHNIFISGHEIASHTYRHIPPYKLSNKDLEDDFDKFSLLSEKYGFNKVIGFHSPKNMWSLRLLSTERKFNYLYDVVSIKNKSQYLPFINRLFFLNSILRLPVLCDDWFVFRNDNLTEIDIFNHFIDKLQELDNGNLVGLGFHPWLMYYKPKLYNAFKKLILHISSNDSFEIVFIPDLVKELKINR